MSILDSVVNATMASGTVVRERHNVREINVNTPNFEADLQKQIDSIMGGGWDEPEMGISREAAVAQLRAADTPEKRQAVIADLIERAISRAGLDTSNGRVNVMVEGESWHGLGVTVDKAVNSAQARELSGLNFRMAKIPMSYTIDGQTFESDDTFAVVRTDTKKKLGTVGSRYKVIQNSEGFDFLDNVLDKFGAKYTSAGSLYGGQKVFMTVHLPKSRFSVNGEPAIEPYAVFMNVNDGSGAALCFPTTERPVCANTLRVACGESGKGIRMPHTGDIAARIESAQHALGLAVRNISVMESNLKAMLATPVDIQQYASDVLDAVLEVTAADVEVGADVLARVVGKTQAQIDAKRKVYEKAIENRVDILEQIMNRYESERCGIGGMRGTVYAGLQSITETADSYWPGRQVGTREVRRARRFEEVLIGERDDWKQAAYSTAVQYAKA